MNEDDRLSRYFIERANSIELPAGEVGRIAARVDHRRRSRHVSIAVAATLAVTAGAVAMFTGGGSGHDNLDLQNGLPGAQLSWTAVDVRDGLGWSTDSVVAADGTTYDLSTAPGPLDPTKPSPQRATLYRSTDGQAWAQLALPNGLSASALATSGGNLYAVGTAPGGGGVELMMATSTDGAATWHEARIPTPRADLNARFPNEVRVSPAVVTAGPSGVVAAVTVTAYPDISRMLPGDVLNNKAGWRLTATGVDVFSSSSKGGGCTASVAANPSAAGSVVCFNGAAATIDKSFTWEQLGLDPALKPLIEGEVHVYTSSDGTTFEEASTAGLTGTGIAGLIGSDDGYRMLVSVPNGIGLRQLRSLDGRTWATSGPDIDGWTQALGRLNGKPAAVLGTSDGVRLLTAIPNGGWASADLVAASGVPTTNGKPTGVQSAAFGPLGVVTILSTDGSPENTYVVHSVDGHSFVARHLTDLAGEGRWGAAGITMNADAVTVRLTPLAPRGSNVQPSPGPQRLLVGTP
jgi:hypothetical protein